ncbi:MAG: glycosyltransferase family 39 protein [Candidatus Peribacteraceae bacterium]|nr:glycosyltransferase family 39 protein [Candidatus Peribacteraceae bacterium]
MIIIAFAVGILLPSLSGWLLLRLLEGRTPVLFRTERWALGFLWGGTLTMSATFLLAAAGLPFNRPGFLAVQFVSLLLLAAIAWKRWGAGLFRRPVVTVAPSHKPPLRTTILLVLLGLWTVAKIGTGAAVLVSTPPFFDDTVKNWNFRGKIFFQTQTIANGAPGDARDLLGALASYPPAVSLHKTWLASLAGEWNEGLVNSIHIVWFGALLILFYGLLRRSLSRSWSVAGVCILATIPLLLIHGTQAYAEVFLAAHLLAAVSFLFLAVRSGDHAERFSFLRLSAVAMALLPLTKNEGLALYLPILLFLFAISLFILRRRGALEIRSLRLSILTLVTASLVFAGPWLAYKWSHGLTFGNAKALSATVFHWEPLAAQSIAVNLFFEGNWLLLFPLLAVAIALAWRSAFRSPLVVLTAAFLLPFVAQIALFLLTSLSVEAVYQTGYSRGVVQIVPIAVALLVLLMHRLLTSEE